MHKTFKYNAPEIPGACWFQLLSGRYAETRMFDYKQDLFAVVTCIICYVTYFRDDHCKNILAIIAFCYLGKRSTVPFK